MKPDVPGAELYVGDVLRSISFLQFAPTTMNQSGVWWVSTEIVTGKYFCVLVVKSKFVLFFTQEMQRKNREYCGPKQEKINCLEKIKQQMKEILRDLTSR